MMGKFTGKPYPIGSMVLLYMVTWIPSIYPLDVSIYTSTMDPMGIFHGKNHGFDSTIIELDDGKIYRKAQPI